MDSVEFIDRVLSRAFRRYGLRLTEGWIDDLIKDQLVPEAIRQGNDVLSAIYSYDHFSYRRALQIAQLRRDGFIHRDAIRIRLFLRGYCAHAREIRSALLTEYVRHSKSLLSEIRSRYVDNFKLVPEKHKDSLAQSLGPIDGRFFAAGLKLDDDTYIELVRRAKQEPIDLQRAPSLEHFLPKSASGELTFSMLATQMIGP
jgi:hypothetical protein